MAVAIRARFVHRMRLFPFLIALTTACAGPASGPTEHGPTGPEPASAARGKDVILVMIDTLRADHLSTYGYEKPTSPELTEFAQGATRYQRAYAQAPWTAPSVASLLTSRYPREVGVRQLPRALTSETRTLAHVLSERGYWTEAIFSNRFICSRYGHHLGFDHYDERYLSKHGMVSSHLITDLALERVREADPDRPLFLYVHYFDPHYDYVLQPGFELGAGDYGTGVGQRSMSFFGLRTQPAVTEWDMVRARALYDSEIAFTDHHVGRLLTGLRALGRFDDAVVIVVADHGEEFLDHGDIGHSLTLYEEVVRVPLLIKAPGQRAAKVVDDPVALLDVAPTALDLAGLSPEARFRGASLREGSHGFPIFTSTFHYSDEISVILGQHKAIVDYDKHTFMLFDLQTDPFEQRSLVAERPELAASLLQQVEDWNEGPFEFDRAQRVNLSEEEKAVMRALGYGH